MNAINKEKSISLTDGGVRTWVMQGKHDTQSGKVLKGSDALNTSIT